MVLIVLADKGLGYVVEVDHRGSGAIGGLATMIEDCWPVQKPLAQVPLCIDGRMLAAPQATGVATYARTLVAALAGAGAAPLILDDADAGRFGAGSPFAARARRWLAARREGPVHLSREGRRLHARDVFRLAQARFGATGRLLQLETPGPPGVMHWTYPVPARLAGWRNIYTVHDVIPLTHPGLTDMAAAPLRARLDAIAAAADRLVTVSAASRRAIVETLGIEADRVIDCGLAVDIGHRAAGPLPVGLIAQRYYLFCGSVEARKNLDRISAAWRASGTRASLAIAGPGDGFPSGPGIVPLGYLPRGALLDTIAGARALLFPTLEEGFGLPVIEAMALGTPVLTADRGALAETAGGAALAVDPRDTAAIVLGITRLDTDAALRGDLIRRGLERAKDFTPGTFAARMLALYADLAGDLRAGP